MFEDTGIFANLSRLNRTTKHLTLLFLIDQSQSKVLLGLKKRGFGVNKFNGFGGKLEPGETVLEGALREMEEESGIKLQTASYAAHVYFEFEGKDELMSVHILRAFTNINEITEAKESEEMRPVWFSFLDTKQLPWNEMWIDDFFWLPYVLQGKVFRAHFLFRGHDQIISHIIKEVESCSEEEWCKEQLSLITIERDALPQKSIDIDFGIKKEI
jgi:8-oxo-dGTP diphosphatase/2-hydroxy-dATP diphosphatase